MKHALIIAAAAAFVAAAPAAAKPGNGNGKGPRFGSGREAPEQSFGRQGPVGYGVGGCPPGLAKKNNGCMPPGLAKKKQSGEQSVAELLGLGSGRRR